MYMQGGAGGGFGADVSGGFLGGYPGGSFSTSGSLFSGGPFDGGPFGGGTTGATANSGFPAAGAFGGGGGAFGAPGGGGFGGTADVSILGGSGAFGAAAHTAFGGNAFPGGNAGRFVGDTSQNAGPFPAGGFFQGVGATNSPPNSGAYSTGGALSHPGVVGFAGMGQLGGMGQAVVTGAAQQPAIGQVTGAVQQPAIGQMFGAGLIQNMGHIGAAPQTGGATAPDASPYFGRVGQFAPQGTLPEVTAAPLPALPPKPQGNDVGGNTGGLDGMPCGGQKAAGHFGGQVGQQGGRHSNLFVGNLSEDVTEIQLQKTFEPYGRPLSWRLFSRNGRTCALVKMSSVQEAEQAVRAFDPKMGGDPKTRWLVKLADSDVGNGLAVGKGGDVSPLAAKMAGGKRSEKGGFGAAGKPGAGLAMQSLALAASQKGGARIRRERMDTATEVDAAPSENLYVKGLPPRITEAQLQRTFGKVGKVVELKILRYGASVECVALVRMTSLEAAESAIASLNGTTPEGAVPPICICFHGKDKKAKNDNLYVKGLPLSITQDQLQTLFNPFGTIRRCRILPPAASFNTEGEYMNNSRRMEDSAALVQYSTADEASQAIEALAGKVPDGLGPKMIIRYAEPKTGGPESKVIPSDNLYVKGLPLGTPDELLRSVFVVFGTVVRLKVLEPRGNEATDCAALVQMSTVPEAKAAVEALHGRVLAAPQPPMRIRFAGKEQTPSTNLYVAGLLSTVCEQQLRATFSQCGTLVRMRLLTDEGRPETHALVEMSSRKEAAEAIKMLHGQPPESLGPTLIVRYATERPKRDMEEHEQVSSLVSPMEPPTAPPTAPPPPPPSGTAVPTDAAIAVDDGMAEPIAAAGAQDSEDIAVADVDRRWIPGDDSPPTSTDSTGLDA